MSTINELTGSTRDSPPLSTPPSLSVSVRTVPLDKENQSRGRSATPLSLFSSQPAIEQTFDEFQKPLDDGISSSSVAEPSTPGGMLSPTAASTPLGTSKVLRVHAQLVLQQQQQIASKSGQRRPTRMLETGAVRVCPSPQLGSPLSPTGFSSSTPLNRKCLDRMGSSSLSNRSKSPFAFQKGPNLRFSADIGNTSGLDTSIDSFVGDTSFNTTSSNLEEHVLELLQSATIDPDSCGERAICSNPVAWTLLNHQDEELERISEDFKYLQDLDRSDYRPFNPSFSCRPLDGPNLARPRPQRASTMMPSRSSAFSVHSPP